MATTTFGIRSVRIAAAETTSRHPFQSRAPTWTSSFSPSATFHSRRTFGPSARAGSNRETSTPAWTTWTFSAGTPAERTITRLMSPQTVTTASRRNRNLSALNASSGNETPRFTTSAGRRRANRVAKSATECAMPLCA